MENVCLQSLVAYVTGPKRGIRVKMGGRRVRQGVRCSHFTRTQVTLHVTCLARLTVFPESHKPGSPTSIRPNRVQASE